MEQLDVSISTTRTDYGSATLKARNGGGSNADSSVSSTTNVSNNINTNNSNNSTHTHKQDVHEPNHDSSDIDFNTDTDADAEADADADGDSARADYVKTRYCSAASNANVGYQSLPDANAATHLFAHRIASASQRFARPSRYSTAGYTKMATSATFSKMSLNADGAKDNNASARLRLERVEIFLGVLNQICIGFVTIYMSWLCLRAGLAGTALHAWLVTIGFSLLMAEAVMCHYSANVLTSSYKRTTKTTLHWVLQVLGGGCGIAGVLIKCIAKGFKLQSVHGKLGFAAFILCLVSMCSGLAALFPMRLKRMIQPLLNKAFHNFLGIGTFVIALLAQYYGYETGFFSRRVEKDFATMIKCITLLSLVLTAIGPLKALWLKLRGVKKQYF